MTTLHNTGQTPNISGLWCKFKLPILSAAGKKNSTSFVLACDMCNFDYSNQITAVITAFYYPQFYFHTEIQHDLQGIHKIFYVDFAVDFFQIQANPTVGVVILSYSMLHFAKTLYSLIFCHMFHWRRDDMIMTSFTNPDRTFTEIRIKKDKKNCTLCFCFFPIYRQAQLICRCSL